MSANYYELSTDIKLCQNMLFWVNLEQIHRDKLFFFFKSIFVSLLEHCVLPLTAMWCIYYAIRFFKKYRQTSIQMQKKNTSQIFITMELWNIFLSVYEYEKMQKKCFTSVVWAVEHLLPSFGTNSSNQITKKEPKFDNLKSKFEMAYGFQPIILAIMHLHNLKVFKKLMKHLFLSFH